MRLLVLTPQLPYPPHQGTTLRNYNLTSQLATRHHVHLLSFVDAPVVDAGPLESICESIHTVPQPRRSRGQRLRTLFSSPLPDMAHRLESPGFVAALETHLRAWPLDIVQFEGIEMIPYLDVCLGSRNNARRPLLVFDDHNAEYVLQKRVWQTDRALPFRWPGAVYSWVQWKRLQSYEARACNLVDVVAAVSERDASALRQISPGLKVWVVPNGVDIEHYAQCSSVENLGPNSLLFTGKMDFRPNVDAVCWFADRVMPIVRRTITDAHFYIVGQRPARRVQALDSEPYVTVTGWVPEVRPFIAGAAVYVVPLRSGGGTRLKVLEAMAQRCPIVSTTMGCDGYPITPGHEAWIADTPAAFAQHVIRLLEYPAIRQSTVQAAFDFARRYDWAAITPTLDQAYNSYRLAQPPDTTE